MKTIHLKKKEAITVTLIIVAFSLAMLSASAESFTLQIYGNANMDDTIDELDIESVQGIIDGTKDKTELADANHDGTIDKEDIAQIELIIDGTEKKLTIADNTGRIVTINKPADKIVCFYRDHEQLVAIGAKDTIVGAEKTYPQPELGLTDIADVGKTNEPNYEKILELMPDLVISPYPLYSPGRADEWATHIPKEIPVAGIDFYISTGALRYNNIMLLGYITDHEDNARKLVDWIQGYESTLVERTNDLTSDEKPTALCFAGFTNKIQSTAHGAGMIESFGGGRNLASGIVPTNSSSVEVLNEWIVEQNPDVIFVCCTLGWNTTTEDAAAMLREFIDKPGWNKMSAVVNNKIYLVDYHGMIARYIIDGCYLAKCLHPELFGDTDPKKVNSDYFENFLGSKVTEGIWMYPEPPSS